ncbi:MAG TPA: hypothetical protein VGN57_00390 [Pirellulaceae bacterium]|jgi:hypothetical protein|nr:hypothetical protein [Pirellulaceae bacterium]
MGLRSTPPHKSKSRFRLKSWAEWFASVSKRRKSSPETPPLAAYRADLLLSEDRRDRWLEASPLARFVAERPKVHAEAVKSELSELPTLDSLSDADAATEAGLLGGLSALLTLLTLPAFDDDSRKERLEAIRAAARRQDFSLEPESPLAAARSVLVGIELPMLAAACFPESSLATELGEAGAKNAGTLLDERFDGDGLIGGNLAAEYPLIAASLMRSAAIGLNYPSSRAERGWLNSERRHQIEMLAWHLWRMVRADGTLALPDIYGRVAVGDAIDFAAPLVRDTEEGDALHRIANRIRKRKVEKRTGSLIVDPMSYSGWAEQGVLRASEKLAAPRLVLNFAEKRYVAELLDRGEPILTGDIETKLTIDGQPAPQEGAWQEVCWHSDDEGDYLELEAAFAGGVRVQRQVFLDRQEQLFLLADSLLLERPAEIVHEMRWTCAPKILAQAPAETNELLLDGPATATTLFPLAAAEWREAPSSCRLSVETREGRESLRMVYRSKGEGAFVPWCFHFTGSRRGIPVTWRRLTVAENREVIPADQAAGYRVQVGDDQWVVYRSLDGPANRTLLGQNLVSEFYLARFLEDGAVEKILELQPDDENESEG